MATARPAADRARWQRFTLLDGFLFQAAFGISFSLVFSTPVAWHELPFSLSLSSVLGFLVAGPLILGAQSLLRGRRGPLSAGEWLWLSPWLVMTVLVLLSLVEYVLLEAVGLLLGFVGGLTSVFSVALALALLLPSADRTADRIPCYWTDRFGVFAVLYTHFSCWFWVLGRTFT